MSSASQIFTGTVVSVTFNPPLDHLPPLTTITGMVIVDVERYLHRFVPGQLIASLNLAADEGVVLCDGLLVAQFVVSPLGGA